MSSRACVTYPRAYAYTDMVYLSRPFRYTGQCRDSDAEVPTTGVDLTHTRDDVLFDVRRGVGDPSTPYPRPEHGLVMTLTRSIGSALLSRWLDWHATWSLAPPCGVARHEIGRPLRIVRLFV